MAATARTCAPSGAAAWECAPSRTDQSVAGSRVPFLRGGPGGRGEADCRGVGAQSPREGGVGGKPGSGFGAGESQVQRGPQEEGGVDPIPRGLVDWGTPDRRGSGSDVWWSGGAGLQAAPTALGTGVTPLRGALGAGRGRGRGDRRRAVSGRGAGRAGCGPGWAVGRYSRHETVSRREHPGRRDEGAPADVAPALMQAHLPRPAPRLRVRAPQDSGRGLRAPAVCIGAPWGLSPAGCPTPEAQGAQDEALSPTRPQFAPLNKNSEDLGTSNFPVTSTSLLA